MLKLDWLQLDESKFRPIELPGTKAGPDTNTVDGNDSRDTSGLQDILDQVDQDIQEMETEPKQKKREKREKQEKREGEESPEDAPETDIVVEPSSQTSEDVHGGDEASGDIEDSPNAMEDGQDQADVLENGDSPESDNEGDSNGDEDGEGNGDGDENENGEGDSSEDGFDPESVGKTEGSDQNESRHQRTDLGGDTVSEHRARKIVRDWIMRLATEGLMGHEPGHSFWDRKKIVKDLLIGREWRIPRDRYSKEPDGLMIMLDFSGSCSWISRTFASLGKAAAGLPNVTVAWGGWEGYVQGIIKPDTDIDSIETYYGDDEDSEVSLNDFLKANPTIRTVVILGDYDGVPRYIEAYKAHRKVKFVWLHPDPEDELYNEEYESYVKKMIYFFDGTVKGLASVVKKLK